MKRSFISLFGLASLALSACSSGPAPKVIYAEPTYNKFGERTGGGCPSGYTADGNVCVPYSGCDSAAAGSNCPIPDGDGGTQNDPTGTGTTGVLS